RVTVCVRTSNWQTHELGSTWQHSFHPIKVVKRDYAKYTEMSRLSDHSDPSYRFIDSG
ncbi:hypothetical protein M378DRAFT_169016, partial [Amanita muscaria Koide BX008]